jgi:hypothetical protein
VARETRDPGPCPHHRSLTNGRAFKYNDIVQILSHEESVKNACENFKAYLEVMRSFGGREVIEL